ALLRLWAPNLAAGVPPIQWADVQDVPAGAVLAAVVPADFAAPTGVACFPARAVPPAPGVIPVRVKDAPGGVEITESCPELVTRWLRPPSFPLLKGDVITHVAGIPVTSQAEFNKLNFAGPTVGRHPRVIGEPVGVTYRRADKTTDVAIHLRNQASAA